jgi:hypothetical protein
MSVEVRGCHVLRGKRSEYVVPGSFPRSRRSPASKLLEAADHIESAVTANPAQFDASPALADDHAMAATRVSTSLAKNKRLEIGHHLFAVAVDSESKVSAAAPIRRCRGIDVGGVARPTRRTRTHRANEMTTV